MRRPSRSWLVMGVVVCCVPVARAQYVGFREETGSPGEDGGLAQGAVGPGHHFGLGIRIAAAGASGGQYDRPKSYCYPDPEPCGSETEYFYGTPPSSPGFVLWWEHLWPGGIVAAGVGLGFHFHAEGGSIVAPATWTQIQLDPRVRFFLVPGGWLRPFVQMAVGFSVGIPGDLLAEGMSYGVDYGIAANLSGTLGVLVAPESLDAAFSFELGPEGMIGWSRGERPEGRYEPADTRDYFVWARHLLMVLAVML